MFGNVFRVLDGHYIFTCPSIQSVCTLAVQRDIFQYKSRNTNYLSSSKLRDCLLYFVVINLFTAICPSSSIWPSRCLSVFLAVCTSARSE